MNKIILLLIALAILVGAALYQQKDRKSRLSSGARKGVEMRELLLPALDVNSVQKIRVKDDKSEVNVALNGTTWAVAERGGYEASFEKISRALLALKGQKNTRKQIVGKESWGKIGVQPPGEPNAYGIGTLVELLDAKGNLKKSLILGANVTSSGNANASPFGGNSERLIRIPEDGDTIWVVGNTFTDLDTSPENWIEKAFFDVQKLKSVEVTAAKPEDSWKASRENADATEFTLEGAKAGEKLDNGKINLTSLLSAPTFNDVLTKDKAADSLKGAVKARLVTFDGFTYDVQTAKQKAADADKYYLTVAVSADLPKERAAVKDEKAEDKKKNDDAFAEEKKKQEEKLAAEKKLAGWVYEVTEYTVSSLLKPRAEILAAPEKKEDAAAPAAGTSPTSGLPNVTKMLEGLKPAATPPAPTPASPLPEAPKPEIKPAPAPDANPVTGEKPAAAEPKK
ncbi:MAG: DUF4340 domain-containing protein [Prosthecobacter sp.]|nr:DUF4340 domain-containing protein [Prosthecobacter sp.]